MPDSYVARPELLERPERINRLFETLASPTIQGVLLVGFGGSGKTTTLYQFAEAASSRNFWVIRSNIKDHYNDEYGVEWNIIQQVLLERRPFWASVVSSTNLESLRDLGEQFRSSAGRQTRKMFREFLYQMSALLHEGVQVVLAVDGLDEAPDISYSINQLESLLRSKPSGFKILATSRSNISLDQFARNELLLIIEMPSLTLDETRSLLVKIAKNVQLDPTALETAASYGRGNPLVVALLGQQLAIGGEIPSSLTMPAVLMSRIYERVISANATDETDRAATDRLFILIALLSPMTASELGEYSGIAASKIIQIVERLGTLVQTSASSNNSVTIGFSHSDFRAGLLSQLIGFNSVDISRLHFGSEEAERDKALQLSFMPPPSVKSILSGDKSIILGERGSGKSAIFRAIRDPDLFRSGRTDKNYPVPASDTHVIPAEDPSAFISTVVEPGASDSSAERFKAAWLLYVSALLAPWIRAQAMVGKEVYKDAWSVLRSVGWQGRDTAKPRWPERLRHWASETVFSKVNKVAFGPVTIEPKFDGGGQSFSRKPLDLASYLDRCDTLFQRNGQRVIVIVDRIDEIAKYDRKQQERLVQGLMMAESYLAQKSALTLVVLLRTDLFELYDIQEKNKFISRTVRLEWEINQLLQIMMRRLFANEQLSTLSDRLRLPDLARDVQDSLSLRIVFPEILEGVPVRSWLAEQLANGKGRISPRQIILLLLLAQEESVKTGVERLCPLFDEGAVRRAMTRLSELSYGEVVSDYRLSTTFVKNCRAGKLREFAVKQVEGLFDLEDGSVAAQTELLERLGFLKRVIVQTPDGPESRFRIPQLFTRCWESEA
jgi:hypothetical protein